MRHCLALTLLGSLLSSITPAQVAPGDIGITGFSTNAFGIATPPSVTGYTTPGFQGTGAATSQAILHDPFTFSDFIVGGFGFVGRATITGPGAVTYTLITNGIGTACQMTWDPAGNIVVADAGTDQVRLLTTGGVVTDLSIGAQPWGTGLNAGAYEPATGDVIVGGNGGLYRLPNGLSTGVLIASGLGGFVSAVQFDPATGDILATILTASRIVRVTSGGAVSDVVPPGTVLSPNALDIDVNGDMIVGGNTGQVFRVPFGGPATLLATNTFPATNVSGLSIARQFGGGFSGTFGNACNATFGPAILGASGPFAVGVPFTTTSINHQPFAIGLWIIGLSNTFYGAIPLPLLLDPLLGTNNCFLNVSADFTAVVFTDAAGMLPVSFTPTPPFAGQRVYIQHAVLEGVPGGFSFSNGVFIQF